VNRYRRLPDDPDYTQRLTESEIEGQGVILALGWIAILIVLLWFGWLLA
jgi:hypothetical protein